MMMSKPYIYIDRRHHILGVSPELAVGQFWNNLVVCGMDLNNHSSKSQETLSGQHKCDLPARLGLLSSV